MRSKYSIHGAFTALGIFHTVVNAAGRHAATVATATWSNSGCLSWVKIFFRSIRPRANADATATWGLIKADHTTSEFAKDVEGNLEEAPEEPLPSPGLRRLDFGQVEGPVSSSIPNLVQDFIEVVSEVVAGVQVVACWIVATRKRNVLNGCPLIIV